MATEEEEVRQDGAANTTPGTKLAWKQIGTVSRNVWGEIWRLMLIGLGAGTLLVVSGESGLHYAAWPALAVVAALAKEVGTALIVSAVAIFGYEFVAHISGMLRERFEMQEQIKLLRRTNEKLKRDLDWRQALKNDVIAVCRHATLAENVVIPVEHASNVASIHSHNSTHALRHPITGLGGAYLDFLSNLFETAVVPVSGALDELYENALHGRSAAYSDYTVPDAREVSGKVLAMLLSSLGHDDCYKSVSNILFYEDALMAIMEKAVFDACLRGVTIQRLFNVSSYDKVPPSADDFKKCKTIVARHLALSQTIRNRHHRDGYQVGFFGMDMQGRVTTPFDPVHCSHLDPLEKSCFGLFCHTALANALLFVALEQKRASSVRLAFCDPQNPTSQFFDELWSLSAGRANPFRGDGFESA